MRDFSRKFAPLQPSCLQYSSGPSSPASPKSPFGTRPRPLFKHSTDRKSPRSTSSISKWKPMLPSQWTWRCHLCHGSYPLGVTRRCLNDGHYLCSGEIKRSKRTGKLRRKHACSSDFDYKGWHAYSLRRENLNRKKAGYEPNGCANNCFHPSECRWHPEQIAERLENSSLDGRLDSKAQDSVADTEIRVDVKMQGVSEGAIGHPNPLSSTPTFPPLAEDTPGQSPQAAEPSAPAAPKASPKQYTATRRKSVRRSSHNLYRSLAERSGRRRAKHAGKRIAPLSPIEEECPSPRISLPTHKAIKRPELTFSNDLDRLLQSDDFESYFESGIWGENKDDMDITIGAEPLDRSSPGDPDSKVSRPPLRFTSSFVQLLDSQDGDDDSSPGLAPSSGEETESNDPHTMLDLEEYNIWANGMAIDYSVW